ncbi:MAG TPA: DUF354 domain-containing protein [Verrucomicrobiae bacterium]|jgi:hypothetical protein|nr:DUF354 domain-containing protein [Verrucomicrobiae bacterium]
MLRNKIYYGIKPMMPAPLRRLLRRWYASRIRVSINHRWPVLAGSERPPAGWGGWPDGKQFGVLLTHDVEGPDGLDKCRQLMKLEKSLGFRASFNFIPEGDYQVSRELRAELTENGFEVGVHDLHHNGKLYNSRQDFASKAARINRYLKEWGAVGFRSGFMHHNLEWLHDLEIAYDASTFDTDPFEPQPDGVNTIFPFWVPAAGGRGYFELPYTLAQDSTLFLVLREETTAIWRSKLDWVIKHGGMVVIPTHPDYMNFSADGCSQHEYPAAFYSEILLYLRSNYDGKFWHGTPRELVGFLSRQPCRELVQPVAPPSCGKVWIDLDNTPHVPLFEPIIEELTRRGFEILLTARDAFQVCELAEKKEMQFLKIGRHHGKNRVRKLLGLFFRAAQLAPVVMREKPTIGFSHGSRSQILTCNLLDIPTLLMADYEFAKYPPLMRPVWEMAPDVIPDEALCCPSSRIRKYPGLKEDVYVPRFRPNPALRDELGLNDASVIVVSRPPATEAHYYVPESSNLFEHFMDRASRTSGVRIVMLPRNKNQARHLQNTKPEWFADRRTIIPAKAVDGLDLIWHSDLVVSGGGTMNREAAALGVPVYSVFRGKIGAVDQQLHKDRRMTLVETEEDADRIPLTPRHRAKINGSTPSAALKTIVDHIVEIMQTHYPVRSVTSNRCS